MRRSVVLFASALGAIAPVAAQIPLQLRSTFVDSQSGGSGNSGVARDEITGNFYVLDSSNQQTVHEFDPQGGFLSQFGLAGCTPSSAAPAGVTYDILSDSLWVLDDNLLGPSLTNAVVEVSRSGTCRGGWTHVLPSSRPNGIAYNHLDDTLWIASSGVVSQWTKTGTRLRGGFSFVTPFGNRRLTGISFLPQRNHFLIIADRDQLVYEVDRSGSVVSVADLSPHGIVDPQGVHFSPVSATLSIVDASQSTVYVFDVNLCTGTVTRFGTGCADPTGTPLRLDVTGCPSPGSSLSFTLTTGAGNTLPGWFIAGTSKTMLPNGTPLPLDLGPLGAPGCSVYLAPHGTAGPFPNPGGGASLNVLVPNAPILLGLETHWQGFQLGSGIPSPLPVVTSDALTVRIG